MKRYWKKKISILTLCALLVVGLTVGKAVEERRFGDVPVNHWAFDSIEASISNGLFLGHSDGSFGLGQQMSRAAFATVLGRLFDWPQVAPQFPSFTDVSRDAWYYKSIETACANGAVTRQSNEFRPADPVTREEMAVMLVRALGYDTLSGLAQDLPNAFADLTTNTGYIAIAHDLGLMSGHSATVFAPTAPATREQAAVVLMRLYNKLDQAKPTVSATTGQNGLATDKPLETVAIVGARLTAAGGTAQLGLPLSRAEMEHLRIDATARGAKALLQITGDTASLQGDAQKVAALVAEEVEIGQWDGVQLDLAGISSTDKAALTNVVTSLGAVLGDKLLFVTVEGPLWTKTSSNGYDFVALAAQADRLIVRVAAASELTSSLPIGSPEPLEEVYYALSSVTEKVDPAKVSLLLTTTGTSWSGTGDTAKTDSTVTAAEIESLRREDVSYYYNRHEAAYLSQGEQMRQKTVWYLDEAAVSARLRMAAFLGVTHVTLSDGGSIAAYEDYSISSALWEDEVAEVAEVDAEADVTADVEAE